MSELYIFHKLLNFSIRFQLDPLSSLISSLSENSIYKYQTLICLEMAIFFALLFIYKYCAEKGDIRKNWVIEKCLLSLLTLGFVYFLDPSLLSLFLLNPLLLILNADLLLKTESKNTSKIILYFLLCSLGIFLAKPLSLLLFFIIFIKSLSGKISLDKFFYLPLGLFALYLNFGNSPIFDYPRDATLTPFSPLIHSGSIDIGIDNLPFTINYSNYLKYRYWSYLTLLTLSLGLLIFQLKSKPIGSTIKAAIVGIFSIYALNGNQDFVTSAIDVPLVRIVPGLAYLPLPMIIPILASILGLDLLDLKKKSHQYAICLSLTILVIFSYNLPQSEVFALELEQIQTSLKNHTIDKDLTPSRYLVEKYKGLSVGSQGSLLEEVPIQDRCLAYSSVRAEDAFKAIDGKTTSKWSTKGPQNSGDYFEIACSNTVEFNKVELLLGSTPADFPRGLTLELDGNKILSLHDWLGPIKKTNLGLPYFGAQQDVELNFDDTKKFNKIKFLVESGDRTFDWSITEVKFYRKLDK